MQQGGRGTRGRGGCGKVGRLGGRHHGRQPLQHVRHRRRVHTCCGMLEHRVTGGCTRVARGMLGRRVAPEVSVAVSGTKSRHGGRGGGVGDHRLLAAPCRFVGNNRSSATSRGRRTLECAAQLMPSSCPTPFSPSRGTLWCRVSCLCSWSGLMFCTIRGPGGALASSVLTQPWFPHPAAIR